MDSTINDFNERSKNKNGRKEKGTWINLSFDDWERLQYKKLYSPDEVEEESNNEETQEDT